MKKQLSKLFILAISYQLLAISSVFAQTGKWSSLKNHCPHANQGVCLLMTDGTVICHNFIGVKYGMGWDRLTPDSTGSYINGTWDTIAPMSYGRQFFASQVLPDGRVFVAGGENGNGDTASQVYNPVTNSWSICTGIPHGWNVYDANSEILYDGTVLVGPQIGSRPSYDCLRWSPITNQFSVAPTALLNHDEAAWLKLPDSSVLFVGINGTATNRYIPQTNTWVADGTVPGKLYDAIAEEAGAAHLLPNGKAIFFGATGFNAIYTPSGDSSPGTWVAADSFPNIHTTPLCEPDAPSASMVNGKILCAISPHSTRTNSFNPPCYFVEYDYTTDSFTQVTDTIPGMVGGDSLNVCSSRTQMLDLPDGNVLLSITQTDDTALSYLIYTPVGAPIASGKPTIDNITKVNCDTYSITGKLFNGISEGAAYGDDWQMATNYPIVRLSNGTHVYYATTSNWNRIGAVRTDSLEDTAQFVLPAMPAGTYSLVVVANGFASNPVTFTDNYSVYISSQTNLNCFGVGYGSATILASGGVSPYTYSWSPLVNTTSSASNLSAGIYTVVVTDSVGCPYTVHVSITQTPKVNIRMDTITNISCYGGDSIGIIRTELSGGNPPYTYSWSGGRGSNTYITGLSIGGYTVTVIDGCGDTSMASTTITQPTQLILTIDSVKSTSMLSCNGEALTHASGGTTPYKYSWTPGGRTTINISNLCPGTYCCYLTDKHGCTQITCTEVITGIENITSGEGRISVYPNPNNGIFTITGAQNFVSKLEVYDVLGERVYVSTALNNRSPQTPKGAMNELDLRNQPNGVYFYRVLNDSGGLLGSGKVVIEK